MGHGLKDSPINQGLRRNRVEVRYGGLVGKYVDEFF